jgi:integrase
MDPQGKRKQPWIPTNLPERGNKRRAEDLLLHYRQTYVPPVDLQNESDLSRNMLFADYMETWLETTRKSVEKTTFGSYSTIVKKGVAPYFRKLGVTVEDLQPRHLQTYYNKQLADVSPRTVHHYHCVIHKALKYLVRLDVIPSNPADRVELPKCNKYVADHYTEDELNHLFEVTKKHPLGLLIKVTAFYGLRRSEVLGLKWDAIDFENNTITIKHIVTSTTIDGKQTLVAADRAKTKSSLRTLPLLEGIK